MMPRHSPIGIPGTPADPTGYTYRMPSQAYIGRVGGLAVALGVGAAIVGGWGCGAAWADDSPDSAGTPASKNEADPSAATEKPGAADGKADTADGSGPKSEAKHPALLRVVV